MRWPLLVAAVAALLFLVQAPPASAQTADEPELRIDALDDSAFPEVRATVTVIDAAGVPVAGLPAEAFSVYAGDEVLPITGVVDATNEAAGISVVLTFDVSGSMAGLPMETAKSAGKSLISQLGPSDLVAVVAFGDSVEVVQPFTSDRAALEASIDALVAAGNTALYEAVAVSAGLAAGAESPRRAVVLLSDGTDFGGVSGATREESLTAAGSARAPVFVVGLGDLIDAEYLESLAAVTSGQVSFTPAPEALEGLYGAIGAVLGRQHLVTFDASTLEGRGETALRLEVSYAGSLAAAGFGITPPVVPAPVAEPAEPEPAPTVADDPAPVAEPPAEAADPVEATGGSSTVPLIAGVTAVGGVLAGALFFVAVRRRRRRRQVDLPEEVYRTLLDRSAPVAVENEAGTEDEDPPAPEDAPPGPPAWLRPSAGGARPLLVDGAPVTVGFSPDCDLVLPSTSAREMERVRIWRRDGRYMVHNLSHSGSVRIGGRPVSWAVLEDGDVIEIGGQSVLFEYPGGASF